MKTCMYHPGRESLDGMVQDDATVKALCGECLAADPAMLPDYRWEYSESQQTEFLIRMFDGSGIIIGQRKEKVVVFGEEPNKKLSRVFFSEEFAKRWLRECVSEKDWKEQGKVGSFHILDVDLEPLIKSPANFETIDFVGNGGPRRFS